MEYPKVCCRIPKHAGKPYFPSNGTEGMCFTDAFCDNCLHERPQSMPGEDKHCDIMTGSFMGEQQKEWMWNGEGWPICTAWKKWDWGNDEDGWNEPPPPEPYDPDQLIMPFILDEISDCVTVRTPLNSVT